MHFKSCWCTISKREGALLSTNIPPEIILRLTQACLGLNTTIRLSPAPLSESYLLSILAMKNSFNMDQEVCTCCPRKRAPNRLLTTGKKRCVDDDEWCRSDTLYQQGPAGDYYVLLCGHLTFSFIQQTVGSACTTHTCQMKNNKHHLTAELGLVLYLLACRRNMLDNALRSARQVPCIMFCLVRSKSHPLPFEPSFVAHSYTTTNYSIGRRHSFPFLL